MNTPCEQYETYDIKVDSRGVVNNSFVGYLNIPLRNVVKAELLSAVISANIQSTTVVYLYIDELTSKFNDRTQPQTVISVAGNTSNIGPETLSTYVSNLNDLSYSLVCIPTEENPRTVFYKNTCWDAVTEFIEPIRLISKLTIKIYNDSGNLINTSAATFLTLRFTCAKRNTCLY
jgi:hypothetical protein